MTVDQLEAPDAAAPKTLAPRVRRRLRILAFIVVPALFMAVLAVGLIRINAPKVRQGQAAPDFSLPLVGGGTLSSGDLKGSPLVINFWASWCDPCNQEAPDLQATWQQYRSKGVRVVGVDYEDRESDAEAFVTKHGVTYPSVIDRGGQLATAFGVRGVPETFFIDSAYRFFAIGEGQEQGNRSGTKILGPVSPPQLKAQIDALVAYKPTASSSGAPAGAPVPASGGQG